MMQGWRKIFWLVVIWFTRKKKLHVAIHSDTEPPSTTSESMPEAQAQRQNRKQRRALHALERARRKHDKFVEPKGPQPISLPRKTHKAKPPVTTDKPAVETEEIIVEEEYHDGSGKVAVKEAELYGEFNFRDTILDQLESYFIYLKRMRKNDPDSYQLYRQIGATLLPHYALGMPSLQDGPDVKIEAMPELPPAWRKHRPGFGCIAYGANPLTEAYEMKKIKDGKKEVMWVPKFLYFRKYKNPPPELQPMGGGDIYNMTVWWDRPFDRKARRKHGTQQDFGIFVSADGEIIRVLKTIGTEMVPIHSKGKRQFCIPSRAWRIPDHYEEWASRTGNDVQLYLGSLFVRAVQTCEHANYSTVRVSASKGDMTAAFGVDPRRMSYFFQDRDTQLSEHGLKKRIFHIVSAHERQTKNGPLSVRLHFRGLREFEWAGHKILVTVPGKHHFMLPECPLGGVDSYWQDKTEDYADMEAVGKQLSDLIRGHTAQVDLHGK